MNVIHDSNQNTTDLEKCLELIASYEEKHSTKVNHINQNIHSKSICHQLNTVLVVGSLGGSFTHEMANCNVLYLFFFHIDHVRNIQYFYVMWILLTVYIYKHKDRNIILWSDDNAVWLLNSGKHLIHVPVCVCITCSI